METIIPREVREGSRGSPLEIKTNLGWAVTLNTDILAIQNPYVSFVWRHMKKK